MNHVLKNFKTPPKEYTQFPFWFWNDELTAEKIVAQIQDFAAKGIYGFVLHPRLGLPTSIPYLGEKFMTMVGVALAEATRLEMHVILYDEGMYPSGSAHGAVVKKDPTLAAKGLGLMTPAMRAQADHLVLADLGFINGKQLQDVPLPQGLAREEGLYVVYSYSEGTIRGVHFGEDDREAAAPKASDLLNPQAVATFIACTHEVYYRYFKKYFGNTVIGFFTDEPSILGRNHRRYMIPWQPNYLAALKIEEDNLAALLPLFAKDDSSLKSQYQDFLYEDLGKTYYGALSAWCQAHDIHLMGHPQKGMDMSMLDYFGVPGQDMVWRFVAPENGDALNGPESTSAKCSADSARHHGKRRNSNEIFGCCGSKDAPWDLTLAQMRWYLNWLFSRGVNLIIPHAFFYSIDGKRKEERPPDVGPHNLWWPEYHELSRYTNRLSYLLTDSVNQTEIAVLCEKNFLPYEEVKSLYQQQIEFNYLEKSLLTRAGSFKDGAYHLQKQSYRVLLVAPSISLTASEKAELLAKGLTVLPLNAQLAVEKLHAFVPNHQPFTGENCQNLRISNFVKEDVSFTLLFNEGLTPVKVADFTTDKLHWDLRTGVVAQLSDVDLYLAPGELQLFSAPLAASFPLEKKTTTAVPVKVAVRAPQLGLTDFKDWCEIDATFSGRVTYQLTLTFEQAEKGDFLVDLGHVADFCVLKTSAQHAATFLYAPPYAFTLHLEQPVQELTLHLEVGNSLTNRYDGQAKVGGLLGPVTVYRQETEDES